MTAVVDVSKGQTDMSYKGELHTLTKLSMKHHVCPGETCLTTIVHYNYSHVIRIEFE